MYANRVVTEMETAADIPVPIRFNPFKHHRDYLLGTLDTSAPGEVVGLLEQVCSNCIDIYTGRMTPDAIGRDVVAFLCSAGVFESAAFADWVKLKQGFRKIELADQSEWILRISDDPIRYVHIHPARTGRYTLRLKGSTFKTICAIKAGHPAGRYLPALEEVNRIRRMIGLSPVKKPDPGKGMSGIYERLFGSDRLIILDG